MNFYAYAMSEKVIEAMSSNSRFFQPAYNENTSHFRRHIFKRRKPRYHQMLSTICGVASPKQIDYPGVNNYSQFSYDGLWRNTKIVETTSGSVTGTKQFVWSGDSRKEERDGSGTTVSKLFTRGQTTTGSLFCYTLDHLSSVRELVDVAGTSQSQISYSPFGQEKFTISNVVPALAYASYYAHQRSHFGLTTFREYGSQQGRWLSRDPNADSTFATIQETLDPADPSAASFGKLKQLNPNLLAIQNATP